MVAAKLFAEIEEAVVQLMLASAGDCLSNGGSMSTGTSAKIETFHTLLSRLVSERGSAVEALAETLLSGDTLSFNGRRAYKRSKRGGMGGDEFHVEEVGTFDYSFDAVAALLKGAS